MKIDYDFRINSLNQDLRDVYRKIDELQYLILKHLEQTTKPKYKPDEEYCLNVGGLDYKKVKVLKSYWNNGWWYNVIDAQGEILQTSEDDLNPLK